MKLIARSLSETEELAVNFVKNLEVSVFKDSGAKILALSGDLGSGKTTFVQYIAKYLGVEEKVTSPTFVIEKIYKINSPAFDHLIHIDAYRLEEEKELAHLGWEEIKNNSRNLIAIEWPEKVLGIIQESAIKIRFNFIDENTREIDIEHEYSKE